MAETSKHVVIIGAGHAGGAAAASLRQLGHDGPITLVGEEHVPPYQRPPLSKGYLKGELDEERLYLKPTSFYAEQKIALDLGLRATAINRKARQVSFSDNSTLSYDALIIATGSRPRQLTVPGSDLSGILYCRTLNDIEELRPRIKQGQRLAVIGAGYIGLEAAAVANQLGMKVTVLEAQDRVLSRVTGPEISAYFERVHREKGVNIRVGTQLGGFTGEDRQLADVSLADGSTLLADTALIGIGILPNTEIAVETGIKVENGIVVDDDARTSVEDIYAIGDCTNRPLTAYNNRGRLESVHNALEQAKLAAAAICGKPRPRLDAPWFWSDQYDIKLQTAGLLTGYNRTVLRGDPETNSFSVWYFKGDQFLAVDAVNAPTDFILGKKVILEAAPLAPEALLDELRPVKDIIQAALMEE